VVTLHAAVEGLASDATQRQCAYRALIMETVDPGEVEAIRLHVQRRTAEDRASKEISGGLEKSTLTPVLCFCGKVDSAPCF
jgi:hypothetical protein